MDFEMNCTVDGCIQRSYQFGLCREHANRAMVALRLYKAGVIPEDPEIAGRIAHAFKRARLRLANG